MGEILTLFSILLGAQHTVAAEPAAATGPLSPQESLAQIVVDSGLRVELVAHEPNIVDPVAIRFDEDGRLWVVEMRDYPTGPTAEDPERSRISILKDADDDGFFETSTVFADGLSFATGVQPWKGGVFVTMAGKVAYLKDTDGDGKADTSETWYTGFAETNTQLRANHPQLALDNHVYIANGLRGGGIVDAQNPDRPPVSISGRDFRFDPFTRKFEAVSGVGQFGLTFNDYGDRFVCTNRNPAIHIVLEDRLLQKNPLVPVAAVSRDVAKAGDESRLLPIGRSWTTSNLHAGQFTAACGVHIFRGDALPGGYYGNIFTCDPTAHLVHREAMRPVGVTFESRPANYTAEFFASRDEWCCPVNLETGPDGALYVVDMYRAIVEHPEWMPEELRHRPNMRAGKDRGRVYRVRAANSQRNAQPKLSTFSSDSLVKLLSYPNAWWRETAARLLLERHDTSVVEQLRSMSLSHDLQLARIHALHLLNGLHAIDDRLLVQLTNDADPRIVEQAVIAASTHDRVSAPLQQRIAALANCSDVRVRFQSLLTAMPLPHPPQHPTDDWEVTAMLISAGQHGGAVLAEMLAYADKLQANIRDPDRFIRQLTRLAVATKNTGQRSIALNAILSSEQFKLIGLAAFIDELARGGGSVDEFRTSLVGEVAEKFDEAFKYAATGAADTNQSANDRGQMIDLLAYDTHSGNILLQLALNDSNQAIRLRSIEALSKSADNEPWRVLISSSAAQSPAAQRAILDGALIRVDRTTLLLDAIAAGDIKATMIDPIHARLLSNSKDHTLKIRAEKLLASAVRSDREEALTKYRPALGLAANAADGRAVFEKHCSICHRIGAVGVQFAPDISDSRERTPLQLLTDILQPNRAIDSNYFSYTVVTDDGRVHRGVLAAETATSITLKQQEGKSETLRRDEIEELRSDGISYMPEELEREISLQDMADLISYIKNWRYLDAK